MAVATRKSKRKVTPPRWQYDICDGCGYWRLTDTRIGFCVKCADKAKHGPYPDDDPKAIDRITRKMKRVEELHG